MKKFAVPIVLTIALALTGCSATEATTSTTASAPVDSTPTEEVAQAPDLTGTWKQSNSASEDAYQQATITADTISVDWVTDGGDTTSVYWVGTFVAPTDASEPVTWTSQRDAAATDSAMLASSDDTKEFTYESGTISYKVSALGTTTTVKLQKE
ncbi:hypothetical protein [Cryobacterium arcticum]|uniref:Lipoprotein n=1 Tax=Cryobacterium arcticum TaxID=670052 RepID=A0A1B1BLW9_9MICO|nr:hypothetical protein [Cryobacterium arcticum]ANP73526.1 hypothetical protein PA27867_2582 [Cryobacterium arcticum]